MLVAIGCTCTHLCFIAWCANKGNCVLGVKAWFVAYFDDDPKAVLANGPKLDRDASRELAEKLFPDATLDAKDDGELIRLNPDRKQVFVGCYGGLQIVAHDELANDYPSNIDARWFDPARGSTAYVHANHSVVDWFAFGLWRDGMLIRSLSVSPDNGIQEQFGDPLPFETPYWQGRFPVEHYDDEEPYPLPFHPLELAEASVLHHLGFQLEGSHAEWVCDPGDIPVAAYAVEKRRSHWRFR